MSRSLLKRLLLPCIGILFSFSAFPTAQLPDLLIEDGDTLPLFCNPLESYFDSVGNRDIPEFDPNCGRTTGCTRGYQAIWKLKGDSLFLEKIRGCERRCEDTADLGMMFGSNEVFGGWYSDTLIIPKGVPVEYVHMGYESVYEKERHIVIEKGERVEDTLITNYEKVPEKARERWERMKKEKLKYFGKKRVLKHIRKRIDPEDFHVTLLGDTLECTFNVFRFYFGQDGRLDKVRVVEPYEEGWKWEMALQLTYNRCCRILEGALEHLDLSSLDPTSPFAFGLGLEYDEGSGRFNDSDNEEY